MLKTLMMSAAVSALMVSGALAQATPPAPAAPAAKDAAAMASPKFIQAQNADQFAFSKFKGTDVLGPDNAKVGDVNDVLFEKGGKVLGLIVGVGGFLGIGEKNVAIDMSAFEVVPATTGTSASPATTDPSEVKLKVSWTKDQLKEAPDFKYHQPASRTSDRPGGSPTTGMTPRSNPPATPPRQ
jgi:sporulation protein YlmC with PRC-barrel domain